MAAAHTRARPQTPRDQDGDSPSKQNARAPTTPSHRSNKSATALSATASDSGDAGAAIALPRTSSGEGLRVE
jgi:hypothetical protein